MKASFLKTSNRRSPLQEAQVLRGGTHAKSPMRRDLAIALPLTSLIDAFSIIVIYLLIGTQSGGLETQIKGNLSLPQASHSEGVDKQTAILRIEKGTYYLNDKAVAANKLTEKLTELKHQKTANSSESESGEHVELMIQADTAMKYADLDPLVKAGSLAGIEKLKFAVVPRP